MSAGSQHDYRPEAEARSEVYSLHMGRTNIEIDDRLAERVMRRYGLRDPYERLKDYTQGKPMTRQGIAAFIDTLHELPAAERDRLKALTPAGYTGLAGSLARRI